MYFTGRDDVFQSLRQFLVPGSTAALTQAISGLGGIGKTHTALEYVYRFHQYYEAVLWLEADSWTTLTSECFRLADELGLPERDEQDQIHAIEEVRRWLRKHHHWLLILDNVENPQEILPKFLPTNHQGSVLVTTRVNDVEPLAQTQVLSKLSEPEGVLFLLRRTKKLPPKAELNPANIEMYHEARQIWQQMDGLPLALDQAGAYILETKCSFAAYREEYARRRAQLLQRRGKRRHVGHEMSVATTFSLALKQVEEVNPMAADILRVCSLLHGEAIPEEIFLDGAPYLGSHLATSPDGWDEAVGILHDYSLVQRNTEARTLTIHRLVQTVFKDTMDESTYRSWAEQTVQAINATLPGVNYRTAPLYERCLSHMKECALLIEYLHLTSSAATRLLYQTGHYLLEHSRYAEAETFYQQCLRTSEQELGPQHLELAYSLNDLGALYAQRGKYVEAETLYQRALRIREQTLGPEHLLVTSPLTGLANIYDTLGRDVEAESLYLRVLGISKQKLSPENPDMAYPFHNLGNHYVRQGKYEEAEPLYQQALRIWEQALGPEHPNLARSFNGLANAYLKQGKYEEAEPLYRQSLSIQEQLLEPENPHLAFPLNNLAELYRIQDRFEEAEPLYQRALKIWEQALGPGHPNLALPLTGLANIYAEQGKYEEAEPLYQRSLRIRAQKLGFGHPKTVESRMRYISMLRETGRQDEVAFLEVPQLEEEREALQGE